MTTQAPSRPAPSRPAPARPTQAATPQAAPLNLKPREPKPLHPKIVHYAVEGFGKTTLGAQAPKPLILMARGETGYDTLLAAGRVPQVPAMLVESFEQLLSILDSLIAHPQGILTLVLDAIGGFERLCHELVCRRDFKGDWSDSGFLSYNKGYDQAVADWLKLIHRLDRLNDMGMTIVILGHARVKPFKNPMGADFDQYKCDVHEKTWAVTARWADAVLFGNFRTIVDQKSLAEKRAGKGKGIGGTDRVIFTEKCDAFDAKNRLGMPHEIELVDKQNEMWATVWASIGTNPMQQQEL